VPRAFSDFLEEKFSFYPKETRNRRFKEKNEKMNLFCPGRIPSGESSEGPAVPQSALETGGKISKF